MWNILPDDFEPGLIREAHEEQDGSLELGAVPQMQDNDLPYKGRAEDENSEDIKGVSSSTRTRVEPAN